MRPITDMRDAVAAGITVLFANIEDTLIDGGRLPACASQALQDLSRAGIAVPPITGRRTGWCDMIARMQPAGAVVGENGAVYFACYARMRRIRRAVSVPEARRAAGRAGLASARVRIPREVPGAAVSADQLYREAVLALDFCKDDPGLPATKVDRIRAIFEAAGAVAKVSPSHVSGWYGAYDIPTMSRRFAAEVRGTDLKTACDTVVFVGDSPNDAPMFDYFPRSCGVANVLPFKDRMEADPTCVCRAEGGIGCNEFAAPLLGARKGAAA